MFKLRKSALRKKDRLRIFVELACYCAAEEGFTYCDPSDPDNFSRADRWFENELWFLTNNDRTDLKRIWNCAINDGRYAKELFIAVKILQEKYGENEY